MFKSIANLYGDKLQASDGDIGTVEDFYFDDRNWVVRYVLVDPGKWNLGKKVILSPHSFKSFHQTKHYLPVNLTKKQIENSPSADTHKPISRQFEEAYYQYYGWPTYWHGQFRWGMSSMPVYDLSPESPSSLKSSENGVTADSSKHHLRCTKAIQGYAIEGKDGISGKVVDFILDVQTWEIQKLVVELGGWFTSQEVEINTSDVIRISYLESTIFVDMDRSEIHESTDHYNRDKELIH